MDFIIELCSSYPQILVFLAIAIGYFVGKIKVFGLNLGSTAGVLLAALVLGQMNVAIPPLLKAVGFALFIFAIGYKVGPQFFGALKNEGLHYIWLSLVVAVTGLVTAIVLGKLFGFDAGTVAGMLGGAMTQSTVIGTADGAINGLNISAAQKAALQANVAVAYAITYIFGVAGVIVFFKVVPKILGLDLKKEASELEAKMSGGTGQPQGPELFNWYKRLNLRAYKSNISGKAVKDLEAMFPGTVAVERIKRGNELIEPKPETIVQQGDEVAIVGNRQAMLNAEKLIGGEVDDQAVIDIVGEIIEVCVTNKETIGKTLGQISQEHGHGVFLRKITRQGHELPLTKDTIVHKCDVLTVAGARQEIESFIKSIGYPERITSTTDLTMVGLGCVVGTLIGLISIPVLGIPITLGVGGGILVAGLVCGWLRTVHPTFGQIPSGAQWIFTDLGLNLFIACVGLTAGPKAVEALQTSGGAVFIAGAILSLMPMIVGMIFGRLVLKLEPVLLFGALTGAGTVTPALNALKEEANSSVPALAYAVPYAFGNVILTIWGTVLVHVFLR
ncbi:MAG: aspartate-alanine antiporter [Candidatus Margulisiibacteriota bacterium]